MDLVKLAKELVKGLKVYHEQEEVMKFMNAFLERPEVKAKMEELYLKELEKERDLLVYGNYYEKLTKEDLKDVFVAARGGKGEGWTLRYLQRKKK